jgi:hypothetical protein
MPADPFLHISPADERIIQQARRRGPKALKKVTEALARKAIDLANKKDKKREKELADETLDVSWPPRFLQKGTK